MKDRQEDCHVKLRPETVELLRDEPELLAIADAIQATQRQHRRGTSRASARRVALVAAAIVAAALAIGVALDLGGSHRDVIDRAAAAAADGRFTVFVATRVSPDESVVSLADGSHRGVLVVIRSWRDGATGRARLRVTRDGAVVFDGRAPRPTELAALGDDVAAVSAFSGTYRTSLEKREAVAVEIKRLSPAEETAAWLRLPTVTPNDHGNTYVGLDPKTFRPTILRTPTSEWRITSYQAVDATRGLSERTTPTGDEPSTLTLSTVSTLAAARQWLGLDVRALDRLLGAPRRVEIQKIRAGKPAASRPVRGATLTYDGAAGPLSISIANEPTQTHGFSGGRLTFGFSPIPAIGYVALTRLTDRWVAQGRSSRIYFSIEGPSRTSVLAVAKALH